MFLLIILTIVIPVATHYLFIMAIIVQLLSKFILKKLCNIPWFLIYDSYILDERFQLTTTFPNNYQLNKTLPRVVSGLVYF